MVWEAYDSDYYWLSTSEDQIFRDPINGKWLKQYYW